MGYSEQAFKPETRYEVAAHGEYDVKVVLHSGTDKVQAEEAFERIATGQAKSSGITKTVELYEVVKTRLKVANAEEGSNAQN
jgi:hypothetical protein